MSIHNVDFTVNLSTLILGCVSPAYQSCRYWFCLIKTSSITGWLFLQILCDLLSPVDENVKVGLRETTQNLLPHLRTKTLVEHDAVQPESPFQKQHQVCASSAHNAENQEVSALQITMLLLHVFFHWIDPVQFLNELSSPCVAIQKWCESSERPGLSRAQSLRVHCSSSSEEGLKRVFSAPQLGDQEKGSLLKRKLSVSDMEPCVVDSGSSKHKKQGEFSKLFSFFMSHISTIYFISKGASFVFWMTRCGKRLQTPNHQSKILQTCSWGSIGRQWPGVLPVHEVRTSSFGPKDVLAVPHCTCKSDWTTQWSQPEQPADDYVSLTNTDCFMSLWLHPVATRSVKTAWSVAWTTLPSVPSAKRAWKRWENDHIVHLFQNSKIGFYFMLLSLSCCLQYLACRKYMATAVLDTLIKQHLSREYEERTKTHLEENRELSE